MNNEISNHTNSGYVCNVENCSNKNTIFPDINSYIKHIVEEHGEEYLAMLLKAEKYCFYKGHLMTVKQRDDRLKQQRREARRQELENKKKYRGVYDDKVAFLKSLSKK